MKSFYNFSKIQNIKTISLNFGPQHPAAHGVLRLVLNLENELILSADSNIGLLHRGTEKLIEQKIFVNSLPYFDRLDYVSTILQEHAFLLNLESLLNKKIHNNFILKTRTIFDEFTRILNHYLGIACHALDVGSMSTIFWSFEDREKIMEFYEEFTGARMHVALYKPNYINKILTNNLSKNMLNYVSESRTTLNEINNVLTLNKIWKLRLKNNGKCNIFLIENFEITGVLARSVGIKKDIRLSAFNAYNNYYFLNFKSFFSKNGDSYDRFLLRICEANESLNIINQNLIVFLKNKNIKNIFFKKIFNKQNIMEGLINHFKYWSSGFNIKANFLYKSIESSKGEFGVTLITDNTNKPFRCKIRSPSFYNLYLLNSICKYTFLADLVTLIGSVDIVFGEVDR